MRSGADLVISCPTDFWIPRCAIALRSGPPDPFVITMFAGRSLSAKRALYQAIVRHLEPFGVPPGDVRIILQEVPRENVGMRGGKAAVDLELGYEVRV